MDLSILGSSALDPAPILSRGGSSVPFISSACILVTLFSSGSLPSSDIREWAEAAWVVYSVADPTVEGDYAYIASSSVAEVQFRTSVQT